MFKKILYNLYCFVAVHMKMFPLRTYYRLRIMNPTQTIRYIKKHKCSIARYGDGEFNIMIGESGVGFQEKSGELAEKLKATLGSKSKNLLICVPWSFNSLRYRSKKSKVFWRTWAVSNNKQKRIVQLIWNCTGKKYLFGDSQITRPYLPFKSPKRASVIFPLLKELWENRDILIVEGEQTRLGIGNDLFSNASSIERILAPSKNAFDRYAEILDCVKERHRKDQLVILALGPTATVLACDLTDCGIQALDIGHIDIEYEWFLSGAKDRIKIDGKYTNEVPGGDTVSECSDPFYHAQIVERII